MRERSKTIPRKRLTADESRARLIDAALLLFSRHGFAETSIQAIADKCGVSQTNVLYHFPSKMNLVANVLRTIVEHNGKIVSDYPVTGTGALKRLERHFHANLAWAVENPKEARLILLLYYMGAYDR